MHLIPAKIHNVQEDRSYILGGIVSRSPNTITGGHIIFELSGDGASINVWLLSQQKVSGGS